MAAEDEMDQKPSKTRPLLSRKVRMWIAAAIGALMLILVLQNMQAVFVRMFFWPMQMPLIVLLLFVFLLGMLTGYIIRRRR